MTEKDLEKLIEDMAEEYATENEFCFLDYDEDDDITDYASLYHAFIEGFKASINFKEEE